MNENMTALRERCFRNYLDELVERDRSIFTGYPVFDKLLCSSYDGLLRAQVRIIPRSVLDRHDVRLKEILVARLDGVHGGSFTYIGGQFLYYAFLVSVLYDTAATLLG